MLSREGIRGPISSFYRMLVLVEIWSSRAGIYNVFLAAAPAVRIGLFLIPWMLQLRLKAWVSEKAIA